MGRNKKYHTDEARKQAIKQSKTKYMLNKEWFCDVCDPNHDYTLAGKWAHINTRKHRTNFIFKANENI